MENKTSVKNNGNLFGVISLVIAVIIIIPILNWFFNITPYQRLQGLPLLLAPFVSLIGLVFGVISFKVGSNKYGKWGIISNTILFVLPFLYYFFGTLIFGP
ncbi:MAG: hypothetical protein AB6733_08960 [Clostridiaceae bacterium]